MRQWLDGQMLGRIAERAAPKQGRARQIPRCGCGQRGDRSSGYRRQGEEAEGTAVWRAAQGRKGGGGSTSQGETLSHQCAAPSAVHPPQPARLSGRSEPGG